MGNDRAWEGEGEKADETDEANTKNKMVDVGAKEVVEEIMRNVAKEVEMDAHATKNKD